MKAFISETLNRTDRRALWLSLLFALSLTTFEAIYFHINYGVYIVHFFLKEWTHVFIFSSISLIFSSLIFFVFTYISYVSHLRYRIIYFVIFVFAVLHEYGYQNAYGRYSDIVDLSIASATTTEQKLNSIMIYFNPIAIIPCIAFFLFLTFSKTHAVVHGLRSFLFVLVLFLSVYTGVWYVTTKYAVDAYPVVSLGAFSRTSIGYFLFNEFSYQKDREKVEQPALPVSYSPKNNIVMVLDESVRGDHLSLNGYSKSTTPYLEELNQKGLLKNWGIAASASTCSLSSHNLLITGLKTEEMPDTDDMVKKVPSVFEYAKAMRYKTYYFDGQMNTFWGGTRDDLTYIDSWQNISDFIKSENWRVFIDFDIAKKVNEIISTSTGNFIFIFKHGNHTPYNKNFPSDETTWTPSFEGWRPNYSGIEYKVSDEEMTAFINSYDNAIKYNLDNFFKNLASDYNKLPNETVIIYTSDHGQTLSEDGLKYSHCGNNPKEAIVPLFMLGNLETKVDTSFKASHANLLATMLDLMHYPEQMRKHDYAISLLKAKASDSKERYFVGANLYRGIKIKFD
jgi:glucan phosphoethanolaminetransferase (alkaline phosphatase superfamily)